jgi:hypothetical protein
MMGDDLDEPCVIESRAPLPNLKDAEVDPDCRVSDSSCTRIIQMCSQTTDR